MPTTIPAGPLADVRDMYVVHRAFRREFGLLPDLIRDVISGDVARAEVVASHLDLVLAGLHMHHTGEDVVLWPLLVDRAAPSGDLIATMEAQHHAVDEYADLIGPLGLGPHVDVDTSVPVGDDRLTTVVDWLVDHGAPRAAGS